MDESQREGRWIAQFVSTLVQICSISIEEAVELGLEEYLRCQSMSPELAAANYRSSLPLRQTRIAGD